jgi:hypothetical protein
MKQLILILLLFSSPIFAQSKVDSIIENKTQELKSIGIKNYFFYNTYCIGSKRLIKIDEIDCSIEGAFIYLFWQEENKSYIQSLGICNNKIEISNNIFDFFLDNYSKIKDEKVEPYQTDKNSIIGISHSCFKKFIYYDETKEVIVKFDEFNLTTEIECPNINYEINNNLNVVLLSKLCDKNIKEYYNK